MLSFAGVHAIRPYRGILPMLALLLLPVALPAAPLQQSAQRQGITVVLDDNYPPYIFRNEHGDLQGILKDRWSLWSQKTGIPVELKAMDWNLAQQQMRAGKADVIDTIFITPERLALYDFSKPYADIEVPIFFRNTISGIVGAESLKGFTVGVKAGDACINVLAQQQITTLKP